MAAIPYSPKRKWYSGSRERGVQDVDQTLRRIHNFVTLVTGTTGANWLQRSGNASPGSSTMSIVNLEHHRAISPLKSCALIAAAIGRLRTYHGHQAKPRYIGTRGWIALRPCAAGMYLCRYGSMKCPCIPYLPLLHPAYICTYLRYICMSHLQTASRAGSLKPDY